MSDSALTRLMKYTMLQSMSDEEKSQFILLSQKDERLAEIKVQLDAIQRQAEANRYSFGTDLLANVTGNVITDTAIFVLSTLFKKLRP